MQNFEAESKQHKSYNIKKIQTISSAYFFFYWSVFYALYSKKQLSKDGKICLQERFFSITPRGRIQRSSHLGHPPRIALVWTV